MACAEADPLPEKLPAARIVLAALSEILSYLPALTATTSASNLIIYYTLTPNYINSIA